jgi:D-amino-acid dehydrogenase
MKIGIIGGGINGLFSAWYLREMACDVTVIDRGDLSDNCSYGNAGMVVPSHIVPLAAPGMMAKGLRWMLSPTSPFYIRPRPSRRLLRWGWLFFKNSTAAHVQRSIPVLCDLSLFSKELFQEFHQEGFFDFGWQEKGLLMLYQTAGLEHEEKEGVAVANKAGIAAHVLSGKEVQDLNPHTAVQVRGGVFYPGDAHLNPGLLMSGLIGLLTARGVHFLPHTAVEDFEVRSGNVAGLLTGEGRLEFDEVVLAAGAWTSDLCKKLGISLPLEGGKGYSFQAPGLGGSVSVPSILLEARATATAMGPALRCAGTMEIAGTDLSVDMNRVRGIVDGINRFFPDLNVDLPPPSAVWSGLRPCSPDGLPYIGRIGGLKNVTVAAGHGMMGLSLGPATGKLVSEIVLGRPPDVDLQALAPGRFDQGFSFF